jgi:hypothetical protein
VGLEPLVFQGGETMTNDAFRVLDAIDRRAVDELVASGDWVQAMKTIRWVAQTGSGLVLTSDGRCALEDMKVRFADKLQAAE